MILCCAFLIQNCTWMQYHKDPNNDNFQHCVFFQFYTNSCIKQYLITDLDLLKQLDSGNLSIYQTCQTNFFK